jgi:hypothetical protein
MGALDANGIEHARPTRNPARIWSIILAGGNGDRISADIHQWMGRVRAFTAATSVFHKPPDKSPSNFPFKLKPCGNPYVQLHGHGR